MEFPIVISENEKTAIILHPKLDLPARLSKEFGGKATIEKLNLGFPWEDMFESEDLPIARKLLREFQIDISEDLKLEHQEGVVTYLIPANQELNLQVMGAEWRFGKRFQSRANKQVIEFKRLHTKSIICREGIAVPKAADEAGYRWSRNRRLVTNFAKSAGPELDISRSRFLDGGANWFHTIWEEVVRFLGKQWTEETLTMNPVDRLTFLVRNVGLFGIGPYELWDKFDRDRWPVPVLGNGGELLVKDWGELKQNDVLPAIPFLVRKEAARLLEQELLLRKKYEGPLRYWSGGDVLINDWDVRDLSPRVQESVLIKNLENFCEPPLAGWARHIQCVTSPMEDLPFIFEMQFVRRHINSSNTLDDEQVLKIAADDPRKIPADSIERMLLLASPDRSLFSNRCLEFPAPYSEAFAYGWERLNLRHPIAVELVRLGALTRIARKTNTADSAILKKLEDLWNDFPYFSDLEKGSPTLLIDAQEVIDEVQALLKDTKLLDLHAPTISLPGENEFVPGTFDSRPNKPGWVWVIGLRASLKFGQPIKGRVPSRRKKRS